MYNSRLQLQIDGTIGLEEVIEFLDKDEVKVIYNGQEVPKIKVLKEGELIWIDENYYLSKSLEWIRKAKSEKDGFNKFFALWVGFNAFYNLYYKKRHPKKSLTAVQRVGDKTKLLELLGEPSLLKTQEKESILDMYNQEIHEIAFGDYKIVLRGKDGDVKSKLKQKLLDNSSNVNETFELLIKALYGIRNNLFHGEKQLSDYYQNKLLTYVYRILLSIFSLMLIKYLIIYHSGDSNASRQT